MHGFETLRFYVAENRIVADGDASIMTFHYFPLVDGNDTFQEMHAQANHVEIQLVMTPGGKREISTLRAEGNVHFEDNDNNQLEANGFSYDHGKQTLSMWSDLKAPCRLNGSPVKGIQMNTKTGEIRTEFIGPVEVSLY